MEKLLPIEYVVIVIYLIFLAAIGPILKSFNKNSDDYFRGGAKTKWWLLGPSLSISITSAGVFTAVAGAVYDVGIVAQAGTIGIYLGVILLAAFLAGWFRRLRKITSAEVIRERFGPSTEQLFSYLNMFTGPMYGGLQLFALSIFVSAVFHVSMTQTILVLGVVVGIYSVSGGKWAVMATDFLQNLVLQVVVVAVGILAFIEIGGIGGFISAVSKTGGFTPYYEYGTYPDGRFAPSWIVAVVISALIGQLQLGWSSRFFAAKDGKEARKASVLMLVMLIVGTVFFTSVPLAVKALYSEQVASYAGVMNKASEASYVVACLNLLPKGLMGLVLVAMFSATASSMDTGLNSNAGVIIRNIVPPLRRLSKRPQLDPKGELVWGRWVSVALVIIIVGMTLVLAKFGKGGLFNLILELGMRVSFPMTLPFFLALFLRKAPRSAANFSLVAGFLGPFLLLPSFGIEHAPIRLFEAIDFQPDYTQRFMLVSGFSIFGFLLSYIFGRKESAEHKALTKAFYADLHRPVDFEAEVGESNDNQQLKVMGWLSLVISGLIYCLLLVPNTFKDRLIIFGMGTTIAAVGIALLLNIRIRASKSKSGADSS